MDLVTSKMAPFQGRTILFVDTMDDQTGVAARIAELGLRPFVVKDVARVADRTRVPYIDAIITDSLASTEKLRDLDHLRYIPIVLVSPTKQVLNLKWCLDNSVSSCVNTPVTALDLANALVVALESNSAQPETSTPDIIYDILLAEDNMVNQKVAVKMLEKYGHSVQIVENGQLAVEAVKQRASEGGYYDVILMDVSMPIMGGMEATELIRAWEVEGNRRRTPIIALTAHAMIGDRDRCLQAGMDDHITKPLRRADLINAITKLVFLHNY